VPPGLRSRAGLLSFIAGAAAVHCSRFQSHGSWLDLGLSSCPLFDYRLASRRLALVCKLPLILSNLRHLKSDESVSPGCQPPTPGSHIHRASSLLNTLLVAPLGPKFPRLLPSPLVSASILRLRSSDMSLTTLLSLANVAVVQLLARYASYPCLFAGLRQCPLAATYPAPGSYILLVSIDGFSDFVCRFPASTFHQSV